MNNEFPTANNSIRTPRLARLFDIVWKRIPNEDRERILSEAPHVYDFWEPYYFRRGLAAQVYKDETAGFVKIELNPKFLRKLYDNQVCSVIAHELAHVYWRHYLDPKYDSKEEWMINPDGTDNYALVQVNDLFEKWGFDDLSIAMIYEAPVENSKLENSRSD